MVRPAAPASIVIVGSGEFGLSTALNLTLRPAFSHTSITVLDRLPFPATDGSSIDSSRIVRTDYSDRAYAQLCYDAQRVWRGHAPDHPLHGIGASNRYTETGLVLAVNDDGMDYTDMSKTVARELGLRCEELVDTEALRKVCGTGGVTGAKGYVNWDSGWADAEESIKFLRRVVEETGRVVFETEEVVGLLEGEAGAVNGVVLHDGREMRAELTVLAAGAWTPGLVDLSGRCVATGQPMGYLQLTSSEWDTIKDMPIVFNLSTGIFTIPHPSGILKIARHTSGYLNPTTKTDSKTGLKTTISTPRTAITHPGLEIPAAAQATFDSALRELFPHIPARPLTTTRLCWYSDTPSGDFLVTHHPMRRGLFLATGGSGHAFKFLPVLGAHIVDILAGSESAQFAQKWGWPEQPSATAVVTRDGSRGDGGLQTVLEG